MSVYTDALVELTDTTLTLKQYYYPGRGSKTIRLSDIDAIIEKKPTLFNGKWRLWGTGSFRVWFALDRKRPTRDAIYYVKIKHSLIKAGFSVEDTTAFSAALAPTGLLRRDAIK